MRTDNETILLKVRKIVIKKNRYSVDHYCLYLQVVHVPKANRRTVCREPISRMPTIGLPSNYMVPMEHGYRMVRDLHVGDIIMSRLDLIVP